jgi:hypothetical protein
MVKSLKPMALVVKTFANASFIPVNQH